MRITLRNLQRINYQLISSNYLHQRNYSNQYRSCFQLVQLSNGHNQQQRRRSLCSSVSSSNNDPSNGLNSGNSHNGNGHNNIDDLLHQTASSKHQPKSFEWNDNIGEEITGRKLTKEELIPILNKFLQRPSIRQLAAENGLKPKLLIEAFSSFRKKILDSRVLDPEIHIIISDILSGQGHVDDLFPTFLKHAKTIYPHIDCLDDLKKISDLRLPPNWYPQARQITRKFYFHYGPTNSGKTYAALNAFLGSKSGIYCGPLKMLAVEVYEKANLSGVPCDLITGEERRFAYCNNADDNDGAGDGHNIQTSTSNNDNIETQRQSSHVSCTVEMSSLNNHYDVAIIDEIQMVRDPERGWAWTRALLGLLADEIHLCGEKAALNLIIEILSTTGECVQIHEYKRLTELQVEAQALESLENVQPGDCIVCFSKRDIYQVSLRLERMGFNVATIYGTLPPATKLLQCRKFNDPNDPCNILVATDAIGMGLNLSIRRIIFYSLIKPIFNEKNEKTLDIIPVHQALQIAGRAGRYNTQYSKGYVTTFKSEDLPILNELLQSKIDDIEAMGLHPTLDQIEMFSYLLPNASLTNLLDIFVSLCQLNPYYFMCNIESIKFLANILEHIQTLPLRARYVFCCAPVDNKSNFVCAMFLKYARQYSNNQPITINWLLGTLKFPFQKPSNMIELDHLLSVYDCLDLYLWLSYRFPDIFLDQEHVRNVQRKLDEIIMDGVLNITKLLRASSNQIHHHHSHHDNPHRKHMIHSPQQRYKQINMLLSGNGHNNVATTSATANPNTNTDNSLNYNKLFSHKSFKV